jgi:hypothetical protein
MVSWLFRANIRAADTGDFLWLNVLRAINRQSADRHHDAGRAVVAVIFFTLALGCYVGADAVGEDLVRAARLVPAHRGAPVRVPLNWMS